MIIIQYQEAQQQHLHIQENKKNAVGNNIKIISEKNPIVIHPKCDHIENSCEKVMEIRVNKFEI